ncbi:MAG: dihydrofolate reductase [Chlorobi bacterium]|nr:dihydrofolate reductase [Chlorobiota bacterium]
MNNLRKTLIILMSTLLFACNSGQKQETTSEKKNQEEKKDNFKYLVEQFADLKIMRYQVPGFDELSLEQKKLVYYLSQAALCGRDIIFDQNYKYNLLVRNTLEEIYKNYQGDKTTDDYKEFVVYLKRVWFSNGIHHHYSMDKFMPGFSNEYFKELIDGSGNAEFEMPPQQLYDFLLPIMFDPTVAAKRVSLDAGKDLIKASACNYYEGVTEKEVEAFYAKMKDPDDPEPISYGLNSKLVKENGQIKELVYKSGGLYGKAIDKIIFWLEKASNVAENNLQKKTIDELIAYYKTGDLKEFDKYNISWVEDSLSHIDFVNGFIENYGDPLGLKASWESIVNFKDLEANHRAETISENAQWFEDHSPVNTKFKKDKVKGVTAKVITVAQLGGDCYPSTPIGINLPNADWIRKDYGSKSVTIENITYAYDQASKGNGFLEEFCYSKEEIALSRKYGSLAGNLHTDLHECLGHASGQLLPGISPDALKNYSSTLEEARADLFALYYMMDNKLIELGIMPSLDAARSEYNGYIRNGLLTQLTRIEPGNDIEEAHMRNRQLIAKWCYEKGAADNVIEKKTRDGKTFYVVNDHEKLRELFGELLAEVQRIKSEGDYEAGKKLVEDYAVKVDIDLNKEVKARFDKLHIAPYGGFINPVLSLVEKEGEVVDVRISYPDDFVGQMLGYSKEYSFLR